MLTVISEWKLVSVFPPFRPFDITLLETTTEQEDVKGLILSLSFASEGYSKMVYGDFINPFELMWNFLVDRTCQFSICWIWVINKVPKMKGNRFTILINVQCIWCAWATHRQWLGLRSNHSLSSYTPSDASLSDSRLFFSIYSGRGCAYWWGLTVVWGFC